MRTVHPTSAGEAYDVGTNNWRAAGVLLTILLSVASALPLAGQRPQDAEFRGGRRVPSIMGQSANDANTILRRYGLEGKEVGRAPSREYRPETVARQEPRPGDPIPQNKVVAYWLAEQGSPVGPQVVTVTEILGTLATITVVAFVAIKLVRRLKKRKKDRHPPPKIETVPFKDDGKQHVASPPGWLAFAFELCPVLDPGNQELDKVGPLVEQGGSQWISNV